MDKAPVFDRTAAFYLERLLALDRGAVAKRLGLRREADALIVPLLGEDCRLTADGLRTPAGGRASFSALVTVSNYLLRAPEAAPADTAWAAYRDFPDAAPLRNYFYQNAERPVAEAFAGDVARLEQHCLRIGGRPVKESLAYDLAFRIEALPRLPVFLLFNDRDAEFPAECRLCFERRAAAYIDMESLAILAALLAGKLAAKAPPPNADDHGQAAP